MTAFAMLAKPSIVNIVPAMTTATGPGQTDLFGCLCVAGDTIKRFVFARECEICLFVVIESPIPPRPCVMTGFAFVT